MSRKCFLVQGIEPGTEFIDLSPEASHHLENVLRLRAGETVELRDGQGNAWAGEIARIGKKTVSVRVLGKLDFPLVEPPIEITLALGLAKADVMDLVVRQATEMGVAGLAIFRAARSQYTVLGKNAEKKAGRWSKIAGEAVCQCGRTRAPRIALHEDLDDFLGSLAPVAGSMASGPGPSAGPRNSGSLNSSPVPSVSGVLKVFGLEGEKDRGLESLKRSHPSCGVVLAAIGPEGGWEHSEVNKLVSAGFSPVHLGPRILRFETAAVALISSIQLLWGDFGEAGRKENYENEMH